MNIHIPCITYTYLLISFVKLASIRIWYQSSIFFNCQQILPNVQRTAMPFYPSEFSKAWLSAHQSSTSTFFYHLCNQIKEQATITKYRSHASLVTNMPCTFLIFFKKNYIGNSVAPPKKQYLEAWLTTALHTPLLTGGLWQKL